ncbi:MAG: sterol desaturase family protein [Candidatus Pacebacteria bacterium]|nr:sterol desaturase family protein [Candidatus Paceibacterota bacterium]
MFTIPIILFSLYVIFGLFEVIHPAENGQSFSGRIRNIGFTALLLIIGGGIVVAIYLLIPFEPRIVVFDSTWLNILMLLGYLLCNDFLFYWYHRIQHTFDVFFQIHELHHSDSELNSTSSLRSYWLERPLQTLLITLPSLFILGTNTPVLIWFPFVTTVWLVFTHANIKLELGFFTPIICGPQLHRIHHSNLPQHRDKNFAQFFPIFDILFGTYYKPQQQEFPPTGTPDLSSRASFQEVTIKPFRVWRKKLLSHDKRPESSRSRT